jgi:4'-phosphopantetheinyl transferase
MGERATSALAEDKELPLQPLRIAQGTTQVFTFKLDLSPAELAEQVRTLNEEELDRAARYRFERDRNRFLAARGILRDILASCLGIHARAVDFIVGPRGKPSLSGNCDAVGLQFNLSHCGGLALLGVTRDGPIGVDLEQVRHIPEATDLVRRFFSIREQAEYESLKEEDKLTAFFNLWTRKEAWLKATGDGISELLHRVEVSFAPGAVPALLALPAHLEAKGEWYLQALQPAPGFIGALALPSLTGSVFHQSWPVRLQQANDPLLCQALSNFSR